MKIKLGAIILVTAMLAANIAKAEAPADGGGDANKEARFSEMKAGMLKNLNDDKSSIDQVISCVNSAQKHDDMAKCREMRKANMEKAHMRNLEERKSHLEKQQQEIQNKLQKLNSESAAPKK